MDVDRVGEAKGLGWVGSTVVSISLVTSVTEQVWRSGRGGRETRTRRPCHGCLLFSPVQQSIEVRFVILISLLSVKKVKAASADRELKNYLRTNVQVS